MPEHRENAVPGVGAGEVVMVAAMVEVMAVAATVEDIVVDMIGRI